MTTITNGAAQQKIARTAGVFYLIVALTSVFSFLYIPSALIVFGDAAATAANIASSEFLFRLGFLSDIINHVAFLFLAWVLYRLFMGVDHWIALLLVILMVAMATSMLVNTFNYGGYLIMMNGDGFLSVFERAQLEGLAYFFLRFHSLGLNVTQVFWGLWLLPFGLLVYKSRFIPKVLGIFLIIGCIGYVSSFLTAILFPQYYPTAFDVASFLGIGELLMILWLLIKGVNVGKLDKGNKKPVAG